MAVVEVVDHAVVVWTEADEVFGGVVLFVGVDVVEVYDFVEFADGAFFGDFSEGFEVDVVGFSLVVGFVFVEVEDVVVAAGAETLCVDLHFSFATFAGFYFWLPVEFFVARVAESFCVVLFFFLAVCAFLNHEEIKRSHIIKFVQTGDIRSLSYVRTSYNVCCANLVRDRTIYLALSELFQNSDNLFEWGWMEIV